MFINFFVLIFNLKLRIEIESYFPNFILGSGLDS
jgi:hypothetical protein